MADKKTNWEHRAELSGTSLTGVLFRNFSESANAAIHAWHSWVVAEAFAARLPKGSRILDLGCGYGRLSTLLAEYRPDLEIIGQDIAQPYCKLYRASVGSCVLGDAESLPFRHQVFDGILAITCLMYAEYRVPELLQGLLRVLRPNSPILLLDPGLEIQRIVAWLRGGKSRSPTGGLGYGRLEYTELVSDAGFGILCKGGNPNLSKALLVPTLATKSSGWRTRALDRAVRADCQLSGYSRWALHRWILAKRPLEGDLA